MKVRLFFTTLAISALMAAQLLACNVCGEPACGSACEVAPTCGQKVIVVRKCDLFAGLRNVRCTPVCVPACEPACAPAPAPAACAPVAPAAPVAPVADCGGCDQVVCCAPCRPLLPLFGPCGKLSQKIRMAACNISNDIECFKAEMDCNIRQAHAEAEARQARRIASRMACAPACGGCGSCNACDAPAAACEEVAVCVPCRPRPGATLKGIMRTLFGELKLGKCAPACACDTCCPAPEPAVCAPAVAACAPAPCKPVCKPVCAPAPCKPVCKPVCAPASCKPVCKPVCAPAPCKPVCKPVCAPAPCKPVCKPVCAPACAPVSVSPACTPAAIPEVAPEATPAPAVTPEAAPEVAPEAVPSAPEVEESASEAAIIIPEVASANDAKTMPLVPAEESATGNLPILETPGDVTPVNDFDAEDQESIIQSEELFPEMPSASSSSNVHFYNASRSIVRN